MRHLIAGLFVAVMTLVAFTVTPAEAQWVGPVNPLYPPPPTYGPPSYYPMPMPVAPAPVYVPNPVVGGTSSSSMYWDPYRGWVTNSQTTSVLASATSPGRAPMPGTSIQYYNYWNGYQWVRGSRWLGQDGLWHGDHENTVVGPGGTSTDRVVYSARVPATGTQPRTTAPSSTTVARPTYRQPATPATAPPRTYVAPTTPYRPR